MKFSLPTTIWVLMMAEQKISRLSETNESDQWHRKTTTKSQGLVQFSSLSTAGPLFHKGLERIGVTEVVLSKTFNLNLLPGLNTAAGVPGKCGAVDLNPTKWQSGFPAPSPNTACTASVPPPLRLILDRQKYKLATAWFIRNTPSKSWVSWCCMINNICLKN